MFHVTPDEPLQVAMTKKLGAKTTALEALQGSDLTGESMIT